MEPTSDTNLLARQDPSAPIGPFDAKAAAIIGDFVYTSPNQSVIWCPPPTDGVYLRSDFRFGPHDPTLWPQPYLDEYPHLAAIPRKPMDLNDPLALMWWNPSRGDFLVLSGGAVDGIGQLRVARHSRFEEMKKELDSRITAYHTNNPPHPILVLLERDLHNVLIRLGSLKTTFDQMTFGVTEFQRCYLETLGLLDYLEIYEPRTCGLGTASTIANCVGVITNKANIVQDFFNAGIPVWFCRPKLPGPFPHNVLEVFEPFEHSSFLCLEMADPPSVIYDGPLDDKKRHKTLHRFSRSSLVFKDPFAPKPLSATRASSSGASTSGASTSRSVRQPHSSKPQPPQSGGRDKFEPLQSPFAPFSIPAWKAALSAVDRTVFVESPCTMYAFPDPGLFVSPSKDARKAKFIEAWLRSRDAWITCVTQEGSLAMNAQVWRDFLNIDSNASEVTDKDTKSAKRRQIAQDLLKATFSSNPGMVPRCTVGEPFVWQGCNYHPSDLPPQNVVRQILWELYELNFAQEFVSLDRRACANLDLSDKEKLYERQSLISKCFPSNALNVAPISDTNRGLAADAIQDRLPYLQCMVQIMGAWKGTKPAIFGVAHHSLLDQQAMELEEAATKYYCQQFYNYFGRAAQVPHRLFFN